ncbi:hypothetical protein [Undibacterium sp. KW1]|uniref:hypothetical protein n=1 Tax=Undibacterium sp. KW1 TaxID=2058624 RepID=UPI0013899B1F|nr:hypothetical protein [Undibacterium sp. KW1]
MKLTGNRALISNVVLNIRNAMPPSLLKLLKVLAVMPCIMLVFVVLVSYASRHSLSYWMLLAMLVLPVAIWRSSKFTLTAAIFLLVGMLLALSPVDFVYKSGQAGLNLLPTSVGNATRPGTVGYGCIARNTPPWALVLSF